MPLHLGAANVMPQRQRGCLPELNLALNIHRMTSPAPHFTSRSMRSPSGPALSQDSAGNSVDPQAGSRQTDSPPCASPAEGRFVPLGEPADIMVCIVSYNSADALPDLIESLRGEAKVLRLRVVVADNDSSDGTLQVLSEHPDVVALPTGGNLGYASGINTTFRLPRGGEAVLVINPDIVVEKGAIGVLHSRLLASQAGIVVPRLLESDGSLYCSLRREPSILRALGDALFGNRFQNRPGSLAEIDYQTEDYRRPGRIEWATGAALLISADMVQRLGDWDDQFFLYSEEVDYFRRAREAGASIWYEPLAAMRHAQGGSGSSPKLNALMAANRIRYVRKHHGRTYAAWFRSAVVLAECLRFFLPAHKGILRTVLDENTWDSLPGPTVREHPLPASTAFPAGSVIIPAHNEAPVIARTLQQLMPVVESGSVEVIVACNGCTDGTAEIAMEFPGVTVLQIDEASKPAALNAADALATLWPRLYLDADIEISPVTLRMVLDRLGADGVFAARPAFRYDDSGASWQVRAFYRARRRMPSTRQALWGAGVYALSQAGRARFQVFPPLTADDLFVDLHFGVGEKSIVNAPPVTVRTPKDASALLSVLRRVYRGQGEMRGRGAPDSAVSGSSGQQPVGSSGRTLGELLLSVRSPVDAFDAFCYAHLALLARRRKPGNGSQLWERDDSSRTVRSAEVGQ